MILKAEEARDEQAKVKSIMDCLATENSWKLSENFDRICKERHRFDNDLDLDFSLDRHFITESLDAADDDDHADERFAYQLRNQREALKPLCSNNLDGAQMR